MKRTIFITICLFALISNLLYAQETNATYQKPVPAHENQINSGFYFQFGPVFPQGEYATDRLVINSANDSLNYLAAKIGGALDVGFLIYIGPAFANKRIRAGLDATFLSFWFNSTKPVNAANVTDNYYYYVGQKYGPVITINPVDHLLIDISYKLNINLAYHYDEQWKAKYSDATYSKYGANFSMSEISVGIRYLIMKFAFQYDFGKQKYDNIGSSHPAVKVGSNSMRIMFGLFL